MVLQLHFQAEQIRDAASQKLEATGTTQLFLDRLTTELGSLPAHRHRPLQGDDKSIDFFTPSEKTRIRYRLKMQVEERFDREGRRHEHRHVAGLERGEATEQLVEPRDEESDTSEKRLEYRERAEPVTDRLRYLRFRYFDGHGWRDDWRHDRPPHAVEVRVGEAANRADKKPWEYPHEYDLRVISIPSTLNRSLRVSQEESR